MRFGHFDDARREYVIDTPRTPLPWINYLGSEDFFSLVSNTGGGYSFYRDARLRRLTRYRYNNSPLDMDGHRIYQRWRHHLEPGLAARQDGTGQLHLPPRSGLHDPAGRKKRHCGRSGVVRAPGRCL